MNAISPPERADMPVEGRRQVLLLQSLMGPFFRRIGQALLRDGYGVHKVNFNGGDQLFWRLPGAINYTGRPSDWPDALARIIAARGITDVLLFGDCRPLHSAAIAVCRNLHIAVHVFEEGYIRPDWVTLELDGVNGHSSLPRDPNYYRDRAAQLPPAPEHQSVPSSFRRRALESIAYNAADLLTRWRYPHWDNHRPWHPLIEGVGWLKRLSDRKAAAARTAALLARLEASPEPYMLFPLQLDADAQVRLHSSLDGVADAIRQVVASFAAHAPAQLRLIVKEHPLDNGVTDWRALTAEAAGAAGVAARVDYMESGDVAVIVRAARGLITINSTTGTLALACGVPVITLGHAVYGLRDITFQGTLDEFWSNPGLPDAATFAAFRRVLIDRCLVPGGFFSEPALEKLVNSAIARLEAHSPRHFAATSRACRDRTATSSAYEPLALGHGLESARG
ncbi:capsule biosynthesis protein [Acidisoma cladoniae]|jgi:capsular polysaccharide export protein|uniref:capsule biosynthesis protein n=1 Tax=Acidisoma cladoniae TaxID=3040935 RepID=UPI00254FEE34|nr:capsular biosynthesis protein [Acidisoma sp. PAMC 29798]